MTSEDILRMARDSGLAEWHESVQAHGFAFANPDRLERFANLVAAHEREACAAICDAKVKAEYATGKVDHNEIGWTQSCAAAIRARGSA